MSGRYVLGVVVAIAVLAWILTLVGRRRMREEYSTLWILAGGTMVLFAVLGPNAERLFKLVGIESVLNALLFFGVIFLVMVNIYASVKISAITNRMKELIQYVAVLEATRDSTPATKNGNGAAPALAEPDGSAGQKEPATPPA